jgi:death on curing protein
MATSALVMTLAGSGLRLDAGDAEIADMILAAAAGSNGYEAIAEWVRPRVLAR